MSQVLVAARNETDYIYNALGQLIKKSGAGGTTLLMYDEAGHILASTPPSGALIQETIWMGDTPVATLQPNGSCDLDLLCPHRSSGHAAQNHTTFGQRSHVALGSGYIRQCAPNTESRRGWAAFNYNLRFPGQYSLNESGLYYNYFRTYDPQMGRYIEAIRSGSPAGVGRRISTPMGARYCASTH